MTYDQLVEAEAEKLFRAVLKTVPWSTATDTQKARFRDTARKELQARGVPEVPEAPTTQPAQSPPPVTAQKRPEPWKVALFGMFLVGVSAGFWIGEWLHSLGGCHGH